MNKKQEQKTERVHLRVTKRQKRQLKKISQNERKPLSVLILENFGMSDEQ